MIKDILKTWKRQIAVKLLVEKKTGRGFALLDALNRRFFHWEEREHLVHWGGDDPDKTYFVIRPRSSSEGLLSLYYFAADKLLRAREEGMIPYVDFTGESCQYYTGKTVAGTKNPWEYYFTQPTELTAEELRRKKNVLLSGFQTGRKKKAAARSTEDPALLREAVYRQIRVQTYVLELAEEKYRALFAGKKTLGVLMRGTDYIALRPHGHPVQPTPEMVMEKCGEFLSRYPIEQIFLVTEDRGYYNAFAARFGERVFTSDDSFADGYDRAMFISDALAEDPYRRGMNYLIRLLLLARCDYLVAGMTNGTRFALQCREGEFADSFVFDLGLYD